MKIQGDNGAYLGYGATLDALGDLAPAREEGYVPRPREVLVEQHAYIVGEYDSAGFRRQYGSLAANHDALVEICKAITTEELRVEVVDPPKTGRILKG